MGYGSYNEDIDEKKGDTSDRYERESYLSPDYQKSARDYKELQKRVRLLERHLKKTEKALRAEQIKRQSLKLNFHKFVEDKYKDFIKEFEEQIEQLELKLNQAVKEQSKTLRKLERIDKYRQQAEDENKALKEEVKLLRYKKIVIVKKNSNFLKAH